MCCSLMSFMQTGQFELVCSHLSMQALWKVWRQGRLRSCSPSMYPVMHTAQLLKQQHSVNQTLTTTSSDSS